MQTVAEFDAVRDGVVILGRLRGSRGSVLWVALDWGTYRTLTGELGLSPDAFEAWLARYYRAMFLGG